MTCIIHIIGNANLQIREIEADKTRSQRNTRKHIKHNLRDYNICTRIMCRVFKNEYMETVNIKMNITFSDEHEMETRKIEKINEMLAEDVLCGH